MNIHWKKIGKFLREKRIHAGLTQRQVAEQFNLKSIQFVSNWERGLCMPPTPYLPTLCRIYKIDKRLLISMILEQTKAELNMIFKNNPERIKKHVSG